MKHAIREARNLWKKFNGKLQHSLISTNIDDLAVWFIEYRVQIPALGEMHVEAGWDRLGTDVRSIADR